MPAPPVYLDENADHGMVEPLRQRGFFVTTAQAEGIVGVDDDAQLAYATSNGYAILSHNRKHFKRLHRQCQQLGTEHAGIILIPQRGPLDRLIIRTAMTLDWIAQDYPNPRNSLFNWGTLQDLLSQGYVPHGYTSAEIDLALGR
jgi:hypothetical protein